MNESVGERPPTLLVSRWKLRPGTNPRAMRARIDRAVKTAPVKTPSKPSGDPAPNEEKVEVGKMTVPKGANPLMDFGFGPAPTKDAKEPEHKKKAKTPASKTKPPSPPPMPAKDSDDSSSSSSDDENRDEVADLVAKTNAIAKTNAKPKPKPFGRRRRRRRCIRLRRRPRGIRPPFAAARRRPRRSCRRARRPNRSSRTRPRPGRSRRLATTLLRHVMTPMQALLNRTLGVKLPAESKDAMNASAGTSKVMRAVKGVVFLENQMRKEEQTEEPDEYDEFFRKRGHDAAKAKVAIAAAGQGDETKRPEKRPVTPPEDPHDFDPNPELIAAADGAVREALAERLRGHTKAELVETAMRVRKELLGKCRGEMRALELRRKREERAAQGARGGKGGKG